MRIVIGRLGVLAQLSQNAREYSRTIQQLNWRSLHRQTEQGKLHPFGRRAHVLDSSIA
jgi:hypothetical protein